MGLGAITAVWGFFFDIHGTLEIDHDPAEVYLGTLNGEATSNLLSRDTLAMSRRRSLPGLLREMDYAVSAKTPETLRGDFTLEAYGSSNADGIDAIQIEIESKLRIDPSKRNVFIEDLAYAISSLVARYADRLRSPLFGAQTSCRGCSEGKSNAAPEIAKQ